MEREKLRQAEAEPVSDNRYELLFAMADQERERLKAARVLIKRKEIPLTLARQAWAWSYLHPAVRDTAMQGWLVFVEEIRTHSGRHRHQGGLGLFIVDGKGYTVVDGVRYDWEKGDLVILPVQPHGCVHQHFNLNPDGPSHFLALIPDFLRWHAISKRQQMELHPDWVAAYGGEKGVDAEGH